MPPVTNTLLQDSSNCTIGSIGHDACRSVWFRVDEESGGGQGFFDGYESGCGVAIPNELLPALCWGGDSIELSGASTAAQLGMKR